MAAAVLVIGLILAIASFSWIESPGLANAPDGDTPPAEGASIPAPEIGGANRETESNADSPDFEPTSKGEALTSDGNPDAPFDETSSSLTSDIAITADNWIVLDANTGNQIAGEAIDEEVAIASTVKIVTALVVLQHLDLSDEVTIEASDLVDPMVHSNMMLMAGDTLTVEQLIQGLLIPSGSDAANALARAAGTRIGGDTDPETAITLFVDAMNGYAEELGLEHTRFANPTGDDDPDAYSSVRDMATLGAELMENEALAEIVAMSDYSFISPGQGNNYTGFTTNQLLGVDGIVGIKTGSTGGAGGCVILARKIENGEMQIIAILGADIEYTDNIITLDSRWDDARAILTLIDNQ